MAESSQQLERLPNNVSGLRHEVKHWYSKFQNSRMAARRIAEENEKRIENVVATAEVVGMAWAISYWNGKSGPQAGQPYQLMGYDADLVVGAALVGLGLFELAGKYDEHLYALGAGALASWATRQGWTAGGNAKNAASGTSSSSSSSASTTSTPTATNTPASTTPAQGQTTASNTQTTTTTTTGVAPAGSYVAGVAPAGSYTG